MNNCFSLGSAVEHVLLPKQIGVFFVWMHILSMNKLRHLNSVNKLKMMKKTFWFVDSRVEQLDSTNTSSNHKH